MTFEIPKQEADRLNALYSYQILDTAPEEAFDDLVRLAAQICGVPIALINFIDRDRQWFKARVGLDICEMSRDMGLCRLCLEQRTVVVIPDTLADARSRTNPVVTDAPFVRFYAGIPLITPTGAVMGTLCILDIVARELHPDHVESLQALGRQVVSQLELRRNLQEVSRLARQHRQAEQEFAEFLDHAPMGLHWVGPDGTILWANQAELTLLGYRREEYIGHSITEFHVDSEVIEDILRRLNRNETLCNYEARLRCQDGSIRPVLISSNVFWKNNEFAHTRCFTQDISERAHLEAERQQAEDALRASEERFFQAFEYASIGMTLVTLAGQFFKVNRALCEIVGYSESELLALTFQEITHVDDLDPDMRLMHQLLAGEIRTYQIEKRYFHKQGHVIWILLNVSLVRDAQDQPLYFIAQIQNITERKHSEEALTQQNQRSQLFADITLKIRQSLQLNEILRTTVGEVQTLLHSERVVIFQLQEDGSGTIVQEATAPDFPAILGQNIHDPCFTQDYQSKYRQGRVSAITDIEQADLHPCHVELLRCFNVRANLVVPILQREQLWGLLIVHQCSGPRQWADFETNLLRQLANQIGIALAQAQLLEHEVQQRQELARSNADLEQFAYVASHDLQEPLRMVASYLQLLERRYKDKLDQNANEFIAYAVDGATRMQALINGLLSYSRVGSRGQQFEWVACEQLLEQAITNLQVAIAENHVTITHEQLPTILADATQFIQLLQNLIGNAIKFRSEEPLQIQVGARQDNASTWLFWVRDNGIGIEAQYAQRIFLIFQRLHQRTQYPGSGIGLAICKKIVERHGGQIWVESQPGQGSTFYFTISTKAGG
jgi:PAS domain S-box-containing protein